MSDHIMMDSLGLGANRSAQAVLAKEGENMPDKENVIFSDLLVKINKRNKEQMRALMITDKAVYNLTTDFTKCKRRIRIDDIFSISVSKISHEFVIHVPAEYDYRFKSSKKVQIANLVNELIKRRTEREAKTLYRESNVLRNYARTKREAKKHRVNRRFSLFADEHKAAAANAAASHLSPQPSANVTGSTTPPITTSAGASAASSPRHRRAVSDVPSNAPRLNYKMSRVVKDSHALQDIWQIFKKISAVGEGSYAKVYLVQYIKRPERGRFALKSIRKGDEFEQLMFDREVSIMQHFRHPGVCRLYDCYEDETNFYLLQRACLGGELFDQVASQGGLKEPLCQKVLAECLQIILHLHDSGVVHRDIKLENLMYLTREKNSRLQLIDFGFARRVDEEKEYEEIVGAMMYLSPELVESAQNPDLPTKGSLLKPCDMWAFGALAYVVITGTHAFASDSSEDETFDKILDCEPPYDQTDMTPEGREFVQRLLVRDPFKRMTAAQALEHPWIKPHVVAAPIMVGQTREHSNTATERPPVTGSQPGSGTNSATSSFHRRASSLSQHRISPVSAGTGSGTIGRRTSMLDDFGLSSLTSAQSNGLPKTALDTACSDALWRILREMNTDLQEGDFREGLEDADDEDDDEYVNGDTGPLPLSMPKLIAGVAEEWNSIKRELEEMKERLQEKSEVAEELQEQQLAMIQDRQRAQLELAQQFSRMASKSDGVLKTMLPSPTHEREASSGSKTPKSRKMGRLTIKRRKGKKSKSMPDEWGSDDGPQ